jgi:hypothetical protein
MILVRALPHRSPVLSPIHSVIASTPYGPKGSGGRGNPDKLRSSLEKLKYSKQPGLPRRFAPRNDCILLFLFIAFQKFFLGISLQASGNMDKTLKQDDEKNDD